MTRRALLSTAAAPAVKPSRNLGGAPAGFPIRTAMMRQRSQPYGMRAIADIPLPRNADAVAAFDDAVKKAREAGGLRITVWDILSWLAAGMTEREILDDYPELEPDDFRAVYDYLQKSSGCGDGPTRPAMRKQS